jgi:thiamine biosynthesis protein ThiI
MKSKKAIVLLSGGIDSPVAAFLAMQNGLKLTALHFSLEPFTGNEPQKKVEKICKHLKIKRLIIIKIGKILEQFARHCNNKYYFVFLKRLMLKIAEKIALNEKCFLIITGESLGQVSSQTLSNLSTISKAISMPVLRPLLPFEKQEIIDFAKKIGTYDISIGPEACDALGPKHPFTKSTENQLLLEEKKIPLNKLINQALNKKQLLLF